METRSMLRGFLQSYISSQWPDLPARFDSLNDDTLTTVLQFVGNNSYKSFGVNKRCKEVYLATKGMTKETFLFGYGPLSRITDRIERSDDMENDQKLRVAVGKGVVFYNRRDVMDWALEERNKYVLKGICTIAVEEGRFDLLEEVFNGVGDWDEKGDVFKGLEFLAVGFGKLNLLKWLETHRLDIDKKRCAEIAAHVGQIHILKWLREETGLKLDEKLYACAINDGHLHVMKWLREQEVDWDDYNFDFAAEAGNLDILQWLHDEGCPWPESIWQRDLIPEYSLEPEVVQWCRANGYSNRIDNTNPDY